jgi:hypothetical protein
VLFAIYAERNGIDGAEREARRAEFFSKEQACPRSSPLGKLYGWAFHFDSESRVALYVRESHEYAQL